RSRGGDRLGGRPRQRHPLRARGNEHRPRRRDRAGAGGGIGRDAGEGGAVGRLRATARAPLRYFARGARSAGCGATGPARGGRGEVAALPLKGVIDFSAEKARLEKEMARVKSDIARIDAKLANADFVARAPEDVVEGEREKREEAEARQLKINEALERLKGA